MLYREVGQYKTNYAADMAVFPILQDRIGLAVILLVAFVVIPLIGHDFLLNTVLIPFLIFSLAAIGLNLSRAMPVCFRSAPVRSWESAPTPA
jgi:branched-chain amino acid transport system permease protein